ncbi:MAG TPA: aminodeoxychorismate lyase [Marinobacter sp.]|uniref:aminotransferase class IV n=1 Tax=Marinobacter sp. TaxID=50741 RepID=UPI000EC605F8|nr:aminotransferase class IV [Marinobacter sp.]MBC7192287.1 aminotransferase class IV [Marinobacter sp.]HCW90410.1 aminodeoxychorismate lyase [Marinobacter sp.]
MVQVIWPDPGVIDVSDRGLGYGDGLFETIRVDCGQPFLLGRHLCRLLEDAGRLGIPVARAEIESAVQQALERLALPSEVCVFKLILTRGSGGRGYRVPETVHPRLIFSVHPAPPAPEPDGIRASVSAIPLVVHPAMAGMKSLERMQQVLASRELRPGEFERIMPDVGGRLIEGTRTNLFVKSGGAWITPPRECLAVAGVMRAELLDCLGRHGARVEQRLVTAADLGHDRLQGMWLTNSVTGIVPVRSMDGRELPVSEHLATIAPHGIFTGPSV